MGESLSQPRIDEFANIAAVNSGLAVEFPEANEWSRQTGALSTDGSQWISMRYTDAHMLPEDLDVFYEHRPQYSLRGLLVDRGAHLEASVRRGSQDFTSQLQVKMLTSYQAIHDARVALGQTPGKGSLRLEPHTAGKVSGGDITEGLTNRVLRTSTYESKIVEHDLEPGDHVISWICMPELVLSRIQAKAQSLKATHGDIIHYEPDERPTEIGDFVGGMDGWENIMKPIFNAVHRLDIPNSAYDVYVDLLKLHRKVRLDLDPEAISGHVSYNFNRRTLRGLGLTEDGMDSIEELDATVGVHKAIAVRTAQVLLKLAEIRPVEDEPIAITKGRTGLLESIIERYAA